MELKEKNLIQEQAAQDAVVLQRQTEQRLAAASIAAKSNDEKVSLSPRYLRGYFSILVVSYFMWSGASGSSDVLLSHPTISLASHISIHHTILTDIYPMINDK
tara:strand:+ start:85 stop:393 length:309 start_codon:yes stop_codon:yes gene_type:complete